MFSELGETIWDLGQRLSIAFNYYTGGVKGKPFSARIGQKLRVGSRRTKAYYRLWALIVNPCCLPFDGSRHVQRADKSYQNYRAQRLKISYRAWLKRNRKK